VAQIDKYEVEGSQAQIHGSEFNVDGETEENEEQECVEDEAATIGQVRDES